MAKTILYVHGRHWKPASHILEAAWTEALRFGIARDFPDRLEAFDATAKRLIYYGDLSNAFLAKKKGKPVPNDAADRRTCFERLKRYRAGEYTEGSYRQLPLFGPFPDALSRSVGSLAKVLRMDRPLIELVAPDIQEYWNEDSEFGTEVRQRMLGVLRSALDRGDSVLVLSHSLGAIIAYDIFWKISRTGEYRHEYEHKKIDLWITFGAPLADRAVQKRLKGFHAFGPRRYPTNISHWKNLWATDDYLCHEAEMSEEYADMLEYGLIESISDRQIYNLALREGESNPHASTGYLMHPAMAEAVSAWVAPDGA